MKKLTAAARVLYTLAKIASVCCIVSGVAIVIAAVLLYAFGNASAVDFTGLTLGQFTFALADSSTEVVRSVFLCEMLPALVILIFGYIIIRIICRILAPMKEGQPFDTSVSANLRKLCWLTLAGGALSQVLTAVCTALLYSRHDLGNLFLNEHITHVTLDVKMDLTFVVLALIWYMLSCIFRYGEVLQQQSDETL